MSDGWSKKSKGSAKVYTHPATDRAIVVNHLGITYDGEVFSSLEEAKKKALA